MICDLNARKFFGSRVVDPLRLKAPGRTAGKFGRHLNRIVGHATAGLSASPSDWSKNASTDGASGAVQPDLVYGSLNPVGTFDVLRGGKAMAAGSTSLAPHNIKQSNKQSPITDRSFTSAHPSGARCGHSARRILRGGRRETEQGGAEEPATRPDSGAEGGEKPQHEPVGRAR
jgi:hypothetical protein